MIEIAGIERFQMESIPFTFEYQGKEYHGFLEWCPGAAGYHWDLMVNKYYWGMLLYVADYEWVFYNQHHGYAGLF